MYNVKLFIMITNDSCAQYIPFGPLIIQSDLKTIANIDCEIIYFTDYAKDPSKYDLKCDLLLISNSPDIVSKHDFDLFVSRIHNTGTPIYIGGNYVNPEYIEKVCKPNNIEYAFVGEGDKLNAEIVLDILQHKPLEKYYKYLYQKDSGQDTSKLEFRNALIQDRPKVIHVPDWILKRCSFFSLEISRGCPKQLHNACNFCSYPKYFRTRPVEDIIAEAHDVLDRKNMFTLLNNSNFNKEIILEIVKTFPHVQFSAILELMEFDDYMNFIKENNIHNLILCVGIESFSASRLKLMNKSSDNVERRIEIARLCHDNNIPLDINLLVGIPGDTQELLLEEKQVLDKYPFIRNYAEIRLVYKEYYSNYQKETTLQSYFDLYYFDEPYNKVELVSVLKDYFNPNLGRLYDKLSGRHTYQIQNLLKE